MSLIAVEREGAVALVRLDRDEKLNAISTALERELSDALASDDVRSSRAVVIAGTGRAFSAGADITEFADRDPEAILRYYRETGNVYEELASLPQPTLAAIHGYCLGGGLELALAADFRIADQSAVLGFPEVGLGILPSSGGTVRATRLLGAARAKNLILLGDRIPALEALALGLVGEVVADAPARALELARRLAELPPAAVAVAKAAIDAAAESSHEAALLIERIGYGLLAQTEDARKALE
ncbi:MAG TPA: enoyl-CoA hydratase/isomerase family protein [Gaiellaceae bacterium]|jgi:enoyl-CoA hydratase/carnithine racemase